jgi:hypothetical protein
VCTHVHTRCSLDRHACLSNIHRSLCFTHNNQVCACVQSRNTMHFLHPYRDARKSSTSFLDIQMRAQIHTADWSILQDFDQSASLCYHHDKKA